jgi:hypothetical protein
VLIFITDENRGCKMKDTEMEYWDKFHWDWEATWGFCKGCYPRIERWTIIDDKTDLCKYCDSEKRLRELDNDCNEQMIREKYWRGKI